MAAEVDPLGPQGEERDVAGGRDRRPPELRDLAEARVRPRPPSPGRRRSRHRGPPAARNISTRAAKSSSSVLLRSGWHGVAVRPGLPPEPVVVVVGVDAALASEALVAAAGRGLGPGAGERGPGGGEGLPRGVGLLLAVVQAGELGQRARHREGGLGLRFRDAGAGLVRGARPPGRDVGVQLRGRQLLPGEDDLVQELGPEGGLLVERDAVGEGGPRLRVALVQVHQEPGGDRGVGGVRALVAGVDPEGRGDAAAGPVVQRTGRTSSPRPGGP